MPRFVDADAEFVSNVLTVSSAWALSSQIVFRSVAEREGGAREHEVNCPKRDLHSSLCPCGHNQPSFTKPRTMFVSLGPSDSFMIPVSASAARLVSLRVTVSCTVRLCDPMRSDALCGDTKSFCPQTHSDAFFCDLIPWYDLVRNWCNPMHTAASIRPGVL